MIQINKKDVQTFMKFLNHKLFWLHIFKPYVDGKQQKGDLRSSFSPKKDEIIKEIQEFNGKGIICLAVNERGKDLTFEKDVKNVDIMVFDIDVINKVDYVSTDEHHNHAIKKAEEVKKELEERGFNVGLIVDSGNGSQVYCKVNLEIGEKLQEFKDKLTSIEKEMSLKFNDDIVKVDCITKDVNRRMKIPGTINKKDTHQAEDRIAKILFENKLDLGKQEKQNNKAFAEIKLKTTLDCKSGSLKNVIDENDRSSFEYRKVLAMLRQNKTREQIFSEMQRYSKWKDGHSAYRELTYSKACKYVETQQIAEEEDEMINLMNYRGLMDFEAQPVDWLIKDQIPKGQVGFLVGKRGEKKTWTALKQAIAICSGKEIFGDEVPEKRKVMIIDEESGENVLAKRLQLLARADGILKEDLDLFSFSFAGLQLDKPASKKFQEFSEIVEQVKPDLIIVDCFQRVCSFDVDKENSLISGLFTGTIRPFIKKYGMSWLFVHHLRKSPTGNNSQSVDALDEVRGGSELVNYARFVLSCSSPNYQTKTDEGAEMLVFKVLKMSNSTIPEPKVLLFQPDNADVEQNTQIHFNYLGRMEDVLKMEVRVGNAIKEFLFNEKILGEFKTKTLIDSKDKIGFSKSNISVGLKQLSKDGFLEKVKHGIYIIAGENEKEVSEVSEDEDKVVGLFEKLKSGYEAEGEL